MSSNPAATLSRGRRRFGRQPGSLATTTGLSPESCVRRPPPLVGRLPTTLLILLPRGTEMFQFPRCPPPPHIAVVSSLPGRGVAPFGFGGLFACMQLLHHVSPRSASFFGSWPLGIHPAPSPAWRDPHSYEMSLMPACDPNTRSISLLRASSLGKCEDS